MQAVVIAPDETEREILAFVLRHAGIAVIPSRDHKRVFNNWEDHPADIILIALGEGAKPIETTKEVRAVAQVPLLIICDMLPERTIIETLLSGADIVLTRPISSQLLSAQLTSMLRRTNMVPTFVLPSLNLGVIDLDPSSHTVTVEGMETKRLTQLEFRLLYTLMTNRGQVIPTEIIVEKVWGYSGEGNRDLVRGLVSRLRRKIEPNPEAPVFLETHSGIGYRFNINEI